MFLLGLIGSATGEDRSFRVNPGQTFFHKEFVKKLFIFPRAHLDKGMVTLIVEGAVPFGMNGEISFSQKREGEAFCLSADFHSLVGCDPVEVCGLLRDALVVVLTVPIGFESALGSIHEIQA